MLNAIAGHRYLGTSGNAWHHRVSMPWKERFRRLTFWNKVAFVGSVASIVALLIPIAQWTMQYSGSLVQRSAGVHAEPSAATNSVTVSDAKLPGEHDRDIVMFQKSYAATIHPSLPPLRFAVTLFSVDWSDVTHRLRIEIFTKDQREPFQTIEPAELGDSGLLDIGSNADAFLLIDDLDFDDDFCYLLNHAVYFYEYRCYSYDRFNSGFSYNKNLSEVYGFYTEIVPHRENQELEHYVKCEWPMTLKRVYRRDGGELKHVASFAVSADDDTEMPVSTDATCRFLFPAE